MRQKREKEKQQTSWIQARLSGVLTIELAYLLPVLWLVFQLVILGVFYYHDKDILIGAASETAVVAAQYERRSNTGEEPDIEGFFSEQTARKMILFSEAEMAVEQSDNKIKITASAQNGYMRVEVCQSAAIVRPEKTLRRLQILQKWTKNPEESDSKKEMQQ